MNKTIEAIEFLKNLGKELQIHEHNSKTKPKFWVVAENKREYGFGGDYVDGEVICSIDGEIYESAKEFLEMAIKCGHIDSSDVAEDYDYDMYEAVNLFYWKGFYVCNYKNSKSVICSPTLFLTKKECETHIKTNKHQYTNPHSYAMTASLRPEVARLFKVLKETDWNSIIDSIKHENEQEDNCEFCKFAESNMM